MNARFIIQASRLASISVLTYLALNDTEEGLFIKRRIKSNKCEEKRGRYILGSRRQHWKKPRCRRC